MGKVDLQQFGDEGVKINPQGDAFVERFAGDVDVDGEEAALAKEIGDVRREALDGSRSLKEADPEYASPYGFGVDRRRAGRAERSIPFAVRSFFDRPRIEEEIEELFSNPDFLDLEALVRGGEISEMEFFLYFYDMEAYHDVRRRISEWAIGLANEITPKVIEGVKREGAKYLSQTVQPMIYNLFEPFISRNNSVVNARVLECFKLLFVRIMVNLTDCPQAFELYTSVDDFCRKFSDNAAPPKLKRRIDMNNEVQAVRAFRQFCDYKPLNAGHDNPKKKSQIKVLNRHLEDFEREQTEPVDEEKIKGLLAKIHKLGIFYSIKDFKIRGDVGGDLGFIVQKVEEKQEGGLLAVVHLVVNQEAFEAGIFNGDDKNSDFRHSAVSLDIDTSTGDLYLRGRFVCLDSLIKNPAQYNAFRWRVLNEILKYLQESDEIERTEAQKREVEMRIAKAVGDDRELARLMEEEKMAKTEEKADEAIVAEVSKDVDVALGVLEGPQKMVKVKKIRAFDAWRGIRGVSCDRVKTVLDGLLTFVRQSGTSHRIYRGPSGRMAPFPYHKGKEVSLACLQSSVAIWGITPQMILEKI